MTTIQCKSGGFAGRQTKAPFRMCIKKMLQVQL